MRFLVCPVLLVVCSFVVLLSFSGVCYSQNIDPVVEEEAKDIYSSVMSPFCPGRLLSDCPSSAADGLKDEIKQSLASGQSREEVIVELYREYGNQMRAVPQGKGFGLLGWIVPVCFLVGGFCFLLLWFRKQRSS